MLLRMRHVTAASPLRGVITHRILTSSVAAAAATAAAASRGCGRHALTAQPSPAAALLLTTARARLMGRLTVCRDCSGGGGDDGGGSEGRGGRSDGDDAAAATATAGELSRRCEESAALEQLYAQQTAANKEIQAQDVMPGRKISVHRCLLF